MPGSNSLSSIQHIAVLMLENRSFDHVLGFLYTGSGAIPPDHDAGEFGFDFTRFGLRVPAV